MKKEKSPCRQHESKEPESSERFGLPTIGKGILDPEVAARCTTDLKQPKACRRMGNLDRVCAYAAGSRWWLHAKPSLQQPTRCISRSDFGHRRTDCYESPFHTRLAGYCVLFARDGRFPLTEGLFHSGKA